MWPHSWCGHEHPPLSVCIPSYLCSNASLIPCDGTVAGRNIEFASHWFDRLGTAFAASRLAALLYGFTATRSTTANGVSVDRRRPDLKAATGGGHSGLSVSAAPASARMGRHARCSVSSYAGKAVSSFPRGPLAVGSLSASRLYSCRSNDWFKRAPLTDHDPLVPHGRLSPMHCTSANPAAAWHGSITGTPAASSTAAR